MSKGTKEDALSAFEGEWSAEFLFQQAPPGRIEGRVVFEREGDSRLLVMRSTPHDDGPPKATSVIGYDDASKKWSMLYWDERGVSRTYEMSWDGMTWTLQCRTEKFHQRFEGRLSADRQTIEGAWLKSDDGKSWEQDFDLTYRRT